VAFIYGMKIKGLLAWFLHRSYHLSRIPSLNRKVRVVIDWTLALFFKREVVSLGQLQEPFEPMRDATNSESARRPAARAETSSK
jgi:NADH dehydrogenase